MTKQIEYKGYLITGTINKKLKGSIINNIFYKESKSLDGKTNIRYESPINFIFSDSYSSSKFNFIIKRY